MNASTLLLAVAALAVLAYFYARQRAALLAVSGPPRGFHSLPGYHGGYVALWAALPALGVLALWLVAEPVVLRLLVIQSLPPELQSLPPERLGLVYNDVRNLVSGNVVSAQPSPAIVQAAERYSTLLATSRWLLTGTLLAAGLGAFLFAIRRVRPTFHARNRVERTIEWLLVAASLVAILTTVGIFVSVLFEALRFFQRVSPFDFLFG